MRTKLGPDRVYSPEVNNDANTTRLSIAQESFWLLSRHARNDGAFNVSRAWRLRGALDEAALQGAVQDVAHRHDILNSHIEVREDMPYWVYDAVRPLCVECVDLSSSPQSAMDEAFRLVASLARNDLDVEAGPLASVTLFRLGCDDHVLLIVLHHLISDAWSIKVFIDEVSQCYSARVNGEVVAPGRRPLQYMDYALLQKCNLTTPLFERKAAFWRSRLSDVPAPFSLPARRVVKERVTTTGAAQQHALSHLVISAVAGWAETRGLSLNMICLAAYAMVLARQSGQSEFMICMPVHCRTKAETKNIIGPVVNPLAIAIRVDQCMTVEDFLSEVRRTVLDAYRHHEYPLERAIRDIKADGAVSWQVPFNLFFNFYSEPSATPILSSVTAERLDLGPKGVKFDLSLTVRISHGNSRYCIDYDSSLFDAAQIGGVCRQFESALTRIPGSSGQRLADIELLSDEEWDDLVERRNATRAASARQGNLVDRFAETAAQYADRVAVASGDETLTFRSLSQRSTQFADYLRAQRCEPQAIVALYLRRSPEFVVALLAILKAGAVALPIDPVLPKARVQHILRDAGASWVVAHADTLGDLPSGPHRVLDVNAPLPPIDPLMSSIPPDAPRSIEDIAYIIYTSGSTGIPKGVMATHRGLLNRIDAQQEVAPCGPGSIICQKTSVSFVDSVLEILGPVVNGGLLAVMPDDVRSSIAGFVEFLVHRQVTHLVCVPSLAEALLPEIVRQAPTLKLLYWALSGELLPDELGRALHRVLPKCTFVNIYGSSEVAADATFHCFSASQAAPSLIGKPLRNVAVYVLDATMHPVPAGTWGELYVGGDGLAAGYLGQPELTAAAFLPSPFVPGLRLYRTGDLARWGEGGNLEYMGRVDRQVKLRGQRIELGEIEAIVGEHPFVREAAVVARPTSTGSLQLNVYVVGKHEETIDVDALRRHLARRIPEAGLQTAIVVLRELPRTASGKLDYAALPTRTPRPGIKHVAPATANQMRLLDIWQEVLKIDGLGIRAGFFDLGGDSLSAMKAVARIAEQWGIRVPLRAMFEHGTVEEFAQWLEDRLGAERADAQSLAGGGAL
ncbi:non-ribosomal peptide synthetase [Burkholderia gladioli]|uniref:non-ribosomal peptide synthetase n=1 Tax=Burkholderia gladioli TaxID=28095 RepID=UPI001641222B|nr:non-ribosomal peptide synthetase [Burkholderia gladioli]